MEKTRDLFMLDLTRDPFMMDKQKLEGILKDSIAKNGFISCSYTTSEETNKHIDGS